MNVYRGIDVSKWQGEINWSRVKNAGIDFAMLRSSFGWGESYKDKFFETNYKNAKKVGIAVGTYHYSYATTPEEAIKEIKKNADTQFNPQLVEILEENILAIKQ